MISCSKKETQKIAAKLAEKIIRLSPRHAIVIGLSGELGSGKTTFAQGFAKALNIKIKVVSPTFTLMKKFEIQSTKSETNSKFQTKKFKTLYHLDCYRIDKPQEILDLGWKDLMKSPENIVLVEWAENIKKIFPKRHIWINFSHPACGGAKGHHKRRRIDIKFVKYYNFGSK